MLIGAEEAATAARLAEWESKVPALAGLRDLLSRHEGPFRITGEGNVLEVACENRVRDLPNRCRLVLCDYGEGRMAVHFVRASMWPESGDRFSHGGIAVRGDRLRAEQVEEWFTYLASAFDAARQPRGLESSFQYPIP
jgi:hypothetical protein